MNAAAEHERTAHNNSHKNTLTRFTCTQVNQESRETRIRRKSVISSPQLPILSWKQYAAVETNLFRGDFVLVSVLAGLCVEVKSFLETRLPVYTAISRRNLDEETMFL